MSGLGAMNWQQVWEGIWSIVQDPYSNVNAALLLLAIAIVFVLLIVVTVIALVARPSRRPKAAYDEDELRFLLSVLDSGEEAEPGATVEGWDASRAPAAEERLPVRRRPLLPWWGWLSGGALALLLVSIAVGYTTSAKPVCVTCHETTSHSETAKSGSKDPHAAVECVRCHEPSGTVGSLTIELPSRLGHMLGAVSQETTSTTSSYGGVISATCLRCHSDVLTRTVKDADRGILMSHAEPVAAGAECGDCHTLSTGVISRVTVGMTPCLRCHNGTDQSAECATCHLTDVGAATRSRQNPADLKGRQLVKTPDCGGCHEQETQCDPCHGGIRMPHSEEFTAYAHARSAAEDLWSNKKACQRCHTATRRPCTKCHVYFPGHPTEWRQLHRTADASYCLGCHQAKSYLNGKPYCTLCHGLQVAQ